MIHNLKTLALGLTAVFAMSAVVASTASAQQGKLTASGPVTLTAEERGTLLDNSFTSDKLGALTCDNSTYTGHKYDSTPHGFIESGATTATITPKYVNCKAHVGLAGTRHAKITMNGCDYVFHAGETTGGVENTYGATVTVACSGGNKIETHVWNDLTQVIVCVIKIGPQSFSGGHLISTSGDIDLIGEFTGITLEFEGTLCKEGVDNEAKLHTDLTIKAHGTSGSAADVVLSD